MTFTRLMRADFVAFAAALLLLLVMALDWYSTAQGAEARRIEELSQPEGGLSGEVERQVQEDARNAAEGAEDNAWQAEGFVNRLVLLGLLATIVLAVGAAFLRAAGRRYEPPWTPSALTALAAALTGLVAGIQALRSAGDDALRVELGAPLGIFVLGVIALAALAAMRGEESGRAWRGMEPARESPAQPPA